MREAYAGRRVLGVWEIIAAVKDFEILASSPLLVPHVRNPGGRGGVRVHAGRVGADFAVRVEESGRTPVLTTYGSAQAAVHAFNDELRRAQKAGKTSSPEPVDLRPADIEG